MLSGPIEVGDRLVWTNAADGKRARVFVLSFTESFTAATRSAVYRLAVTSSEKGWVKNPDVYRVELDVNEASVREHCVRDPLPHGTDAECFAMIERQAIAHEIGERFRDALDDPEKAWEQLHRDVTALGERAELYPEREQEKQRLRKTYGEGFAVGVVSGRKPTESERDAIENAVAERMLGIRKMPESPLGVPVLGGIGSRSVVRGSFVQSGPEFGMIEKERWQAANPAIANEYEAMMDAYQRGPEAVAEYVQDRVTEAIQRTVERSLTHDLTLIEGELTWMPRQQKPPIVARCYVRDCNQTTVSVEDIGKRCQREECRGVYVKVDS